jgi:hypothetical protein
LASSRPPTSTHPNPPNRHAPQSKISKTKTFPPPAPDPASQSKLQVTDGLEKDPATLIYTRSSRCRKHNTFYSTHPPPLPSTPLTSTLQNPEPPFASAAAACRVSGYLGATVFHHR